MNNYIENNNENKDIQRGNFEKKNSNWFKERRESLKSFFEWKKNEVIRIFNKKSEWLKDFIVDSNLLDTEKWSNLSDSEVETKKELAEFLDNSQENITGVSNPEKILSQKWYDVSKFKGRSSEIVQEIENLAMNVEDEIKNYNDEENSIARALLHAANLIMDTENKS